VFFAALKIHVSPKTKAVLDTFGSFELELRGEVEMKVRIGTCFTAVSFRWLCFTFGYAVCIFFKVYCKESMYSTFKDKLKKIVPLTNLNKYFHNDTSAAEVNINISGNNGSEKLKKKSTATVCIYLLAGS
jgi:hypothetical protein